MSGLSRLIDKARGWLGSTPPPPAQRLAVHQDRFNRALFDEVLADAPPLTDLIEDLNRRFDYTDELVSDVFAQFFQADPRLRAAGEMAASHLVNHGVATDVAACPETAELRGRTQHDQYGAAMATISVGEKVRGYLQGRKDVAEQAKQAEQAQDKAQQAQDGLQQALQGAQDAADAQDQQMGDFDGNGPLTEAQVQAADATAAAERALKAALGKAQKATEQAQASAEQTQQLAAQVKQALRGPVREGVKQAAQDLEDEADLFRAWGVEDGEVQRMSFAERQQRARMLRNNRLSKFVKQLGRWRMMAAAQRAKKVVQARDEVYDTELSGRLPDVMASEFVSLAIPTMRPDFLVRLTEGRLLSKKFRGTEQTGQGPICVLVDTSSSMHKTDGHDVTRECWAKGLMLAMLDQARSEHRDFVVVIFANASKQRTYHFPKGEATLEQVLEVAELFLGGGTDFAQPLDLAIDIIDRDFNSEHRGKADIIMITDDECAVTPEWMRTYQERKARLGFRTFGVAVGMTKAGSTLTALSDNVRAVQDFVDPSAAADLIRTV